MQNLTHTFSKPEFQAELLYLLPYIIAGQLLYIIARTIADYISCSPSKDFNLRKTLVNSLKIAISITILLTIVTIVALLKKYN